MADLRERLAAAKVAASAIEGIAFKMNPPNIYTPQFVQLAQTIESALHEVLAHPEKLMGEPVAWRYECGSWTHLLSQPSDNYFSIDRGQSFIKGQPLYAPEVKP